jgi:predicted aminopeptidase
MPYRGYFNLAAAKKTEEKLKSQGFDTFVRGVVAYSTLGWFSDPLTTPMLSLAPHHLVETLIHEVIHTHLFIRDEVDFNEGVATFLGIWGAQLFYIAEADLQTAKLIEDELQDQKLFSSFIQIEIHQLKEWYRNNPPSIGPDKKQSRIREIQTRFKNQILPKMRSEVRKGFADISELNNARLLGYRTYFEPFEDLYSLKNFCSHDFQKTFQALKRLEKTNKPRDRLAEWARGESLNDLKGLCF